MPAVFYKYMLLYHNVEVVTRESISGEMWEGLSPQKCYQVRQREEGVVYSSSNFQAWQTSPSTKCVREMRAVSWKDEWIPQESSLLFQLNPSVRRGKQWPLGGSLTLCSLCAQGDPHLSSLEVCSLPGVNRWVIIASAALWANLEDMQSHLFHTSHIYPFWCGKNTLRETLSQKMGVGEGKWWALRYCH